MSEELESIGNPYGRLAWLIDDYLRRMRNPESAPIVQKLSSYRLPERYPDSREEQVRSYCELACTSFPVDLVKHFHRSRYLYRWIPRLMYPDSEDEEDQNGEEVIEEEFSHEEWIAEICTWLGFQRPYSLIGGVFGRLKQLRDSLAKLERGRISRQEVTGCGLDAHNVCVEILKDMLKFYGRFLWGEDPTLESWIDAMQLRRNEARPLQNWIAPQRINRERYTLDLGELEKVYKRWNNTVLLNPELEWVLTFQTTFARNEVLPPELFEILKSIRFGRGEFAHPDAPELIRLPEYKELARADLKSALTFIELIDEQEIFPKIIVMQRRMVLEGGEVRLDYLNEVGELQHVRFSSRPIKFYPRIPVYYYQPMTEEEMENPTVLTSKPIFMPVDENWGP